MYVVRREWRRVREVRLRREMLDSGRDDDGEEGLGDDGEE